MFCQGIGVNRYVLIGVCHMYLKTKTSVMMAVNLKKKIEGGHNLGNIQLNN